MLTFAALSDLHNIYGHLPQLKQKFPEALWLITGDITDNGFDVEYSKARAALAVLDFYLCVPGNHDYGRMGNFYNSAAADRFDDTLTEHWKGQKFKHNKPAIKLTDNGSEKVCIIGLNSNLKTILPFDFACGRIGLKQRLWLWWYLHKYRDYVKIIILHHHPFMHTNPFMWLQDSEKFMKLIASKVDVLLFGHRHRFESKERQAARYRIKHILASGSPKEKYPNNKFWLLRIEGKDVYIDPQSINGKM